MIAMITILQCLLLIACLAVIGLLVTLWDMKHK